MQKLTILNRNSRRSVVHKNDHFTLSSEATTQQQFKAECDINNIVKNAQRGVSPKYLAQGEPQFGDFANVPDLNAAHDLINSAHSAFMNLPSALRSELDHDPSNLSKLTKDQVERYKLGKPKPPTSDPSHTLQDPSGAPNPPAAKKKAAATSEDV